MCRNCTLLFFSNIFLLLYAQIIVSDDGSGTGTTTWTANLYFRRICVVNSGDELTMSQ